MQVRVKTKILSLFLLFNVFVLSANANNLDDAIEAYKAEDYNSALKIIKKEIEYEPNNYEAYKWLAKTYEAMFEIEKSLEAYKEYERLKRNSELIVSPSINPSSSTIVSSKPSSIKPSIKPTPLPTSIPTVKATLSPIYKGWQNIKIIEYNSKSEIKLIPKNSPDMIEINEKLDNSQKFLLLKCKIKYSKNIIIKQNSDQISLIDDKNKIFPLYGMSTYKFNYGGNKASQKVEVILVSDYYELSKKDSRDKVQFLFKVDKDSKIKILSIKGYGEIKI